ncbi:polymer-forming cytoskeletal protein [Candidatus Berkelbacteria bacterium]|nr:polymer-forming cytoskeletal protein [Candidatus Berkelbacteria bacterium]
MKNMQLDGSGGPGTVVGVNVALSGTLKDQNDIIIYGMVDGEVFSEKHVNVGETAQVKGPVRGDIVTISGTVRGEINALTRLEITESGKVYGSILTKDLVVNSGALIMGQVEMGERDEDEDVVEKEDSDTENEKTDDEAEENEQNDDFDVDKKPLGDNGDRDILGDDNLEPDEE